MTMINVVNKSTKVSNADVHLMTRACAAQLRMHAAPAWGFDTVPVVYLADESHASPGSWVLAVLDDADQAGDLGWHTEDQGDLIYGRVFATPVLDNGGDALSKPLSVASVLSHEVLETFGDPNVNRWCDDGQNTLYAMELCDPVENDSYPVQVSGKTIMVSNFVCPAWFDAQAAPHSRFDWMQKVTGPFKMSPHGYVVKMESGKISQQFGAHYPEWRKATKQTPLARSWRRSG